MAIWLPEQHRKKTRDILAFVIQQGQQGQRVKFLVDPGIGNAVVQRMRVALSRSRNRNRQEGRKINEFTLHADIFKYSFEGRRYDCIVAWTEKLPVHRSRELLDDLVERENQ